jgi:asparagine synthase (glutamine-hydrolysing)
VYGKSKKIEENLKEEVAALIEQSIKRRLVSDVPVGVFLSGGLDSSIIAYYAARHIGESGLQTFSVGFNDPSFDESEKAIKVAAMLGTKHHSELFSDDVLDGTATELFEKLDEPLSDSSLLSQYFLSKTAAQKVKVTLGGDASDELFAGYDTFRALKISRFLDSQGGRFGHKAISALLGLFPASSSYMPLRFRASRLGRSFGRPANIRQLTWLSPLNEIEIEELLGDKTCIEELYSEAIEEWDSCNFDHEIDRTLNFYGKMFLQNQILVKLDRMSMLHGLEVRTPFLDIDLVNCVRKIPHYYKLNNRHTKYILKRAAENILPKSIVWQRKVGFSAPLSRWICDGSFNLDSKRVFGHRGQELIEKRLRAHRQRKEDNRIFLWNIYVLSKILVRSERSAEVNFTS